MFAPLLSDIKTLDKVYIDKFGTVYSVVADNLAAHGLAGLSESFRSTYFCRFCLATQTEMQTSDAVTCSFEMRTKDLHNNLIQEIQNNDSQENYSI